MEGVVLGFATIATVIAVGALVAHLGVVDLAAQGVLARVSFFVASPALLVTTVSRADVHDVLSRSLVATVVGVAVPAVAYAVGGPPLATHRRRARHRRALELVRQRRQPRPAGRRLRPRRRGPRRAHPAPPAPRPPAPRPGRPRRRRCRPATAGARDPHRPLHQPPDRGHPRRGRPLAHRVAPARGRRRARRAHRRHGGPRGPPGLRHLAAARPRLRWWRAARGARPDEHAQARGPAPRRLGGRAPRPRHLRGAACSPSSSARACRRPRTSSSTRRATTGPRPSRATPSS